MHTEVQKPLAQPTQFHMPKMANYTCLSKQRGRSLGTWHSEHGAVVSLLPALIPFPLPSQTANRCSEALVSTEVLSIDKGVCLLTSQAEQVNAEQLHSLIKDEKHRILGENLAYRDPCPPKRMLISTQCEGAESPKGQVGDDPNVLPSSDRLQ